MSLAARVNEQNPDPRIACVLLLDTSASMQGAPIEELNRGFKQFCEEIDKDDLAKKRAEIAVITFGQDARVEIPFTEARDLVPRHLTANGLTPMGAALNLALDELEQQKAEYRRTGLEYYRPWLFVLTDGIPTDSAVFGVAAQRLKQAEDNRKVSVFAIGIGDGADLEALRQVSTRRKPLTLAGLSFGEFFSWLSASLSAASASNAHGGSDSEVSATDATEQIRLPVPSGWAVA